MIKIHKYHVNPDKICAVYQDNDVIKIDMDSGNTLQVRPNVISLAEILILLTDTKPKQIRQTKRS